MKKIIENKVKNIKKSEQFLPPILIIVNKNIILKKFIINITIVVILNKINIQIKNLEKNIIKNTFNLSISPKRDIIKTWVRQVDIIVEITVNRSPNKKVLEERKTSVLLQIEERKIWVFHQIKKLKIILNKEKKK